MEELAHGYLLYISTILLLFQGPVILAQNDVVTILCLGADATLSLMPKSAREKYEPQLPLADVGTIDQTSIHRAANKTGGLSAKSKDVLKVTLVHGDLLAFIGDDFEVVSTSH